MATSPTNAPQLRGAVFAIMIVTIFAAIWGWNGSAALPGFARVVSAALVILVTVGWFGTAYALHRTARQLPDTPNDTPNLFRTRAYWLAVLGECIAIPVAARLLVLAGHPDAVICAVAAIVGLHFFGLIPVLRSPGFAVVGGAMVLLALGSLALPASVAAPSGEQLAARIAVVGLGSAVILWAGIASIVVIARRGVAQQPVA